jgi:dUTP pyrophosphatase
MELRIKKLYPDAILPTRSKPGDSGLDLHAYLPEGPVTVLAGDRHCFDLGIAIELPQPPAQGFGYEAQVRPRSGLKKKHGVMAGFGTIDSGYRGELGLTLFNMSFRGYTVRHGDRIAQLVVCPVVYPTVVEVESLSETERGTDGFGSTGV